MLKGSHLKIVDNKLVDKKKESASDGEVTTLQQIQNPSRFDCVYICCISTV